MKKYVMIWLGMFSLLPLSAQPEPLSLARALELALSQRQDLAATRQSEAVSALGIADAKNARLPRIEASGDFRLNTQLQTSILPGEFANQEDPVAIRFGTRFAYLLGLNATQPIFRPEIRDDIQLAALQVEISQAQSGQQEENIRLQVAQAYYSLLLSEEKLRLSQGAEARAQGDLREAEVRFQQGSLLNADYERLRVALRNAAAARSSDARSVEAARLRLNYQLGAEAGRQWALSDSLRSLSAAMPLPESAEPHARQAEWELEQLQHQLYGLNYEKARRSWLPDVSAVGNYSVQHFSDAFRPFGADSWFPFSYLGVQFNWSLLDGLRRRSELERNRLRMEASESNLRHLESRYRQDWETARLAWESSRERLGSAQADYQLALTVLEAERSRFAAGSLTPASLEASNYALLQAEVQLLNALYDWLVADLELRRAGGLLASPPQE